MKTLANFKSKAFRMYPNEDDEILNTNRWGKRLAEFIRDGLPQFGVQTGDIFSEDWGWLVNTREYAFPLWLGCGPVDGFGEAEDTGQPAGTSDAEPATEFAVFVKARPGFFQRFFKRMDTKPAPGANHCRTSKLAGVHV